MTGQKISIAQLRPTQMTLGLDEVASRAAKIAAMEPADLEALLKKKSIPYVLGPGKQIYIVDHHHLVRALLSLKIAEAILGDQLADGSDTETKEFWRLMESITIAGPSTPKAIADPMLLFPPRSRTSPTISGGH